jgi:hypothetical protein
MAPTIQAASLQHQALPPFDAAFEGAPSGAKFGGGA